MKSLPLVARILLGLIFAVFGVMALFQLGPEPPAMGPEATAFMEGIMGTGYFFPLLKVTEIACGILLLSGFFVPLALTVLAPIVINIVAFHLVLDLSGGAVVGFLVLVLELYLGYCYRSSFAGVLQQKAAVG